MDSLNNTDIFLFIHKLTSLREEIAFQYSSLFQWEFIEESNKFSFVNLTLNSLFISFWTSEKVPKLDDRIFNYFRDNLKENRRDSIFVCSCVLYVLHREFTMLKNAKKLYLIVL